MNKVAFYLGLIVLVLGLIVWIIRPHRSPGKSTIKFLGFEFSFDTPAFTVMVLGIVLMVLSPNFPGLLWFTADCADQENRLYG